MLVKSKVLETINDFPDTFSMDDLFEKLYVVEKIEKGIQQGEKGLLVSEDEADKIIDSW